MLQIYSSLTKEKMPFKPIKKNKVGIYVCGMTVYDLCHIGHARVMVVFDVVSRYLRARGFEVTYVRNITDIDDKIIKRAHERGISTEALAQAFIEAFHEDERALHVLPPDVEPRATEHVQGMIAMIDKLCAKDFAYVADNGDVFYRINAFERYGQLSHKDIEGLRAGARVEVVDAKQDPLDFVLWKMAKEGEPSWHSPWGLGRPGWHIECSVMSTLYLGNHFDIHGGGFDLQFPHHENEIAQAEAATGETFVNTWMHVGFVQIDKEKMSKSLGNFFTIREVLEKYQPEVVRYFMIASHYRSPVNYSQESLNLAQNSLQRLYTSLRGLDKHKSSGRNDYSTRFNAAMDDDFNTPLALSVLFDLAHEINRHREQNLAKAMELATSLRELGGILGILQTDPDTFLKGDTSADMAANIEALITERNQARAEKDWTEADRIRDQLLAMGIILEDKPSGTVWRHR